MGRYLNPTNTGFKRALNSPIYVDKTGMIEKLNRIINTSEPMVCVSRPRRFGKSTAINMLTAYYSKGCASGELFENLKISRERDFKEHLNRYDVIRLDMQWMMGNAMEAAKRDASVNVIRHIQEEVIEELRAAFPDVSGLERGSLSEAMLRVNAECGAQFIVLIDEWDAVFRNHKENEALQKEYLDMLRGLFKGVIAEECIVLAYITGIFPVKKYGTESALNNFKEFTMINPKWMAEYVGFTESEVRNLCGQFGSEFDELQKWYDGYFLKGAGHVYSPRSVVEALLSGECGSYWTSTETYESLKGYISMNFQGLKDDVIAMLGGGRQRIDPQFFQNDLISFESRDDVLTLLVHLGYLAYDYDTEEAFIPNEEVRGEFVRAVKSDGWKEVVDAIERSEDLLRKTLSFEPEQVAECLEAVHADATSILNYNDENSLSCVISLAYYSARKDYLLIRELPTGKGFADIVFLPRKQSDKPAMIVELKWNREAEAAISQIKERHYVQALEGYIGEILLVGISYDRETKKHQCVIEKYQK